MEKLLIIADDFTGALDTGVQFAGYGLKMKIFTKLFPDFLSLDDDIAVVVVNTDSRHMGASDAFDVVFRIVEQAKNYGFKHVYKKVDSGLRGNIGAELSAVMDALGVANLHFIPAYPKLKRITAQGLQYIDDKLLTQSIFAKDPFNPPLYDSVKKIIASTTDKNIILNDASGDGIHVYDAKNDEDMVAIRDVISSVQGFDAVSGCAGFAPYLAEALGYEGCMPRKKELGIPLLVVCGSMNSVSIRQMDAVENAGVKRFFITARNKLDPSWAISSDFRKLIERIEIEIERNGIAIIDVNSDNHVMDDAGNLRMLDLAGDPLRVKIAGLLGSIAKVFLDKNPDLTIFTIGGDTLKAIVDSLDCTEITPVCELDAGVVLNSIEYKEKTVSIVSKSGGFGDDMTVLNLLNETKEKESVV